MTTDAALKRIFPVTGALILLGICAAVTLALLIDAAARSGMVNALLLAPWPLLALWVVYVVGVASDIRADGAGMRVQNFLRRTWAPWPTVQRIAMRWQLEVTLSDASVLRCFGGPTRSRPRKIGPERTREQGHPADDGIARLRRLRADAVAAGATDNGVVRSWDVLALAALMLLIAWAVVAIIATR